MTLLERAEKMRRVSFWAHSPTTVTACRARVNWRWFEFALESYVFAVSAPVSLAR
jgi:hypothetical protein